MTEHPMDDNANEHPDEGTIHAWLDGALDAPTAERIAAHVHGCSSCAERVAEARGLIAGASRIVAALDDVPARARPAWAQSVPDSGATVGADAALTTPTSEADRSLWRRLRVTPTRAAIAATLIVAVGITLTRQRAAVDNAVMPMTASAPAAPRQRDSVLDSAVARSLSIAQPQRSMEASKGLAVPQAPAGLGSSATLADSTAGERVAVGRRAVQALRETTLIGGADRSRVARPPSVAGVQNTDALTGAVAATEVSGGLRQGRAADMAAPPNIASAKECFRLESTTPGATWGGEPFPLIVVVEAGGASAPRAATVLSVTGAPTSARATFARTPADSVHLTLRRLGYSGMIALGPDVGGRAGMARSAPSTLNLEGAVTTAYAEQGARAPNAAARSAKSAPAPAPQEEKARNALEPRVPAPAPTPAAAQKLSVAAGAPVQVSMRPLTCPQQ
jgi:hypothetical protein